MLHPQIAISDVPPGFADPVHDTQRAFRTLLDTLSRPGTIGHLDPVRPESPAPLRSRVAPAAFASLLALCDDSTPVFLGEADAVLASAVRFHTGAPIAGEPHDARFAYLHDPDALPPLERFACGMPDAPEQSVTLFIRVESLMGGAAVLLRGPGIEQARTIAPEGLPPRFWQERAALAPLFPCGIDCYLVCGRQLVGLPRTTLVEVC
ncbi:phosphonate C-P lyase system protein PhnH [Burkholderia alba]|uniref:phosphonate C-P lyase system protein PhnH n=1 Tax=Burkholderia alba TaxID=2683677 RepID=UPI002B05D10B|nr:phosphonate C-P lyase system protein PhnH [Burkholderia alba]